MRKGFIKMVNGKFLDLLCEQYSCNNEELVTLKNKSENNTVKFIGLVHEDKGISLSELYKLGANIEGFDYVDLSQELSGGIDENLVKVLTKNVMLKYRVIPLSKKQQVIRVATYSFDNLGVFNDISDDIGQFITPVITDKDTLEEYLNFYVSEESNRKKDTLLLTLGTSLRIMPHLMTILYQYSF